MESPKTGTDVLFVLLGAILVLAIVREARSRRAVARLKAELAAVQAQLSTRNDLADVGQLVSGVAHELNNPLQSILGFTELLIDAEERPELRRDLEEERRAREEAERRAKQEAERAAGQRAQREAEERARIVAEELRHSVQ